MTISHDIEAQASRQVVSKVHVGMIWSLTRRNPSYLLSLYLFVLPECHHSFEEHLANPPAPACAGARGFAAGQYVFGRGECPVSLEPSCLWWS